MRVKTKLIIGIGLLFGMILLLATVSSIYVNGLKKDTSNILKANYNTLLYARNMMVALDEGTTAGTASAIFMANLSEQKMNMTEPGESRITEMIEQHYQSYLKEPELDNTKRLLRKDLSELMRLNMDAIARKSQLAEQNAETAIVWISITAALCLIIAFTLLLNMPGSIANPIRQLTLSIQEIAAHNYHQRVNLDGRSEFAELGNSFNTMAEKLEEYANSKLDKILKENKRLETLVNNQHDPVLGIDENGKFLFVNEELLKVVGMQESQLIGHKVADVVQENDLLYELLHTIKEDGRSAKAKMPIKIFANGKESYFEKEIVDISIVPTGEQDAQPIGYFVLLRNVTSFKELEFAKTNFISTVSHELKTPIAAIKMSLDILAHKNTGALNTEQQDLLQSIKEDSERLLKITSELLNMAQVETGNIQLNIHPNNPLEILNYALDATKTSRLQKQLSLREEIAADLPFIPVDAEKTAWVLTNFITNAIRYSPLHTEIVVSLQCVENRLLFSVRDSGSGIDKRYQERIFERYFQVPGSSKVGTGLGLAISKDFIESQGGEIGVESALGMGSLFYFSFPV